MANWQCASGHHIIEQPFLSQPYLRWLTELSFVFSLRLQMGRNLKGAGRVITNGFKGRTCWHRLASQLVIIWFKNPACHFQVHTYTCRLISEVISKKCEHSNIIERKLVFPLTGQKTLAHWTSARAYGAQPLESLVQGKLISRNMHWIDWRYKNSCHANYTNNRKIVVMKKIEVYLENTCVLLCGAMS